MNNEVPLWYKLIVYWCRQRVPKGYGLTIPFIIGTFGDKTISELFTEIKDSKLDEKVILRMCYDLNEYVLSIDDINNPIATLLDGEKALLYNDEKIESFTSFNEIIAFLESKYSQVIAEKTYSKNVRTGEWEKYTPSDIDTINKFIAINSWKL